MFGCQQLFPISLPLPARQGYFRWLWPPSEPPLAPLPPVAGGGGDGAPTRGGSGRLNSVRGCGGSGGGGAGRGKRPSHRAPTAPMTGQPSMAGLRCVDCGARCSGGAGGGIAWGGRARECEPRWRLESGAAPIEAAERPCAEGGGSRVDGDQRRVGGGVRDWEGGGASGDGRRRSLCLACDWPSSD